MTMKHKMCKLNFTLTIYILFNLLYTSQNTHYYALASS